MLYFSVSTVLYYLDTNLVSVPENIPARKIQLKITFILSYFIVGFIMFVWWWTNIFFLKGERFVIRNRERGRKMGRGKERITMRASSIDFISAFPLLNRQDIFLKQSRQVALYPHMLYLLLLLH